MAENMMDRGRDFLTRQLGNAAGRTVVYMRSGVSSMLTAWVGRTLFAVNNPNAGAARVEWGERDYLILVASLVIGGVTVTPLKGDRITETIGGADVTFEIMSPSGEPAWRYSDVGRTLYRVHCKRVA